MLRIEFLKQILWLISNQRYFLSVILCVVIAAGECLGPSSPGTLRGLDELPQELEVSQLPTGSEFLLKLGENSYFGCKSCIFSGSIGLPRHGNSRMFHFDAVERKSFSVCSGTRIQVQDVSSRNVLDWNIEWVEAPRAFQCSGSWFFWICRFFLPSPTANGAAQTDGSVCESGLLQCKILLHAERGRANFKWKLIAMIRGKNLLIGI